MSCTYGPWLICAVAAVACGVRGDPAAAADSAGAASDTDTAPGSDPGSDADYVVNQVHITWTLGLVDGRLGDVPGVTEAVTLHFSDAARWQGDFDARRGQCMVVLDPALAGVVDWSADLRGMLAAWEFSDAEAAALGTAGDCARADLDAVDGDPVAWLRGQRLGFGLRPPPPAAAARLAERYGPDPAVLGALLQGVVRGLGGRPARMDRDHVVFSFATDALGVVVDQDGEDVWMNLATQPILRDGVFVGRPLGAPVAL